MPSDGYLRNNAYNNNTTSVNINCTDITTMGTLYSITSNISLLNASNVSCRNLSSTNILCRNISTLNANVSFLNVSSVSCTGISVLNLSCQNASLVNLYVYNETATWISNCSILLCVAYGSITNLNVSNAASGTLAISRGGIRTTTLTAGQLLIGIQIHQFYNLVI